MAEIRKCIMDQMRDAFKSHGPSAMLGTYDGAVVSLTMQWPGGFEEQEEYIYDGQEFSDFKEYMYEAFGRCVQRHIAKVVSSQDRQAFLKQVIGPEEL